MSRIDLNPKDVLEPGPVTSAYVRPTNAPIEDGVNREEGIEALVSAIDYAASAAVTDFPARPTTTEPLSVWLAALPSEVRSSLVSELEATQTFSTNTRPTPPSTGRIKITSSSTMLTSTRASNTSSSSVLAGTNGAAPPADSQQMSNGTIAGVATGVVAGAVLIILGIVLVFRRGRQRQAPFGPRGSQRSQGSGQVYPEIAWLYDPTPTPPNEPSHHTEESAASLLARMPRAPEMTAAVGASPRLQPVGSGSPLLPPDMPFARAESPGGSSGASPGSSRYSSPLGMNRTSAPSSTN